MHELMFMTTPIILMVFSLYTVEYLRDSNCITLIGGIKFGDLVLSIVERYLTQCPFLGVSLREILLYRHKKRGAGIFKRWHGWAKQTLSSLIFCN